MVKSKPALTQQQRLIGRGRGSPFKSLHMFTAAGLTSLEGLAPQVAEVPRQNAVHPMNSNEKDILSRTESCLCSQPLDRRMNVDAKAYADPRQETCAWQHQRIPERIQKFMQNRCFRS
jgi:hypothetical protein